VCGVADLAAGLHGHQESLSYAAELIETKGRKSVLPLVAVLKVMMPAIYEEPLGGARVITNRMSVLPLVTTCPRKLAGLHSTPPSQKEPQQASKQQTATVISAYLLCTLSTLLLLYST